jgi:protoporphyrinogen oxidase
MSGGGDGVVVLGAGLAGLSSSFHLEHDAVIYEATDHYGGHASTEERGSFTWDEGPHISFTTDEYVRELFLESTGGEIEEFPVQATNWFRGSWVDHPAQTSLHQVPEPLRSRCVEDMVAALSVPEAEKPADYGTWLRRTYGETFAENFPAAYTRKYWTTDPSNLGTDWIGPRMYRPTIEEVVAGAKGSLGRSTYYIQAARYPSHGGFGSFTDGFARGARIDYGKRLERAHLGRRELGFADGSQVEFGTLISTIPITTLVACAEDAPDAVRDAAALLRCSELLLVEVCADHPALREERWMYVYDEDKLSTRINFTEGLSPNNAPAGTTGIQVEVYGSEYRALPDPADTRRRVVEELIEMGLVASPGSITRADVRHIRAGNVIFDLNRAAALREVERWLDQVGVLRAGRYSEWKYLWTDGCVLSGRRVAEAARSRV